MRISHQATQAKFESALQKYQKNKWTYEPPNNDGVIASRKISTLRQVVSIIFYGILCAATLGKKFKSDLNEAKEKKQVVQLVCDDKEADINAIYQRVTGSLGADKDMGGKKSQGVKKDPLQQEPPTETKPKALSSSTEPKPVSTSQSASPPASTEKQKFEQKLKDLLDKNNFDEVYPMMGSNDFLTDATVELFAIQAKKLKGNDINSIDFAKIPSNRKSVVFFPIFGGRSCDSEDEGRIKNLSTDNLRALLPLFQDHHFKVLASKQIDPIDLNKIVTMLTSMSSKYNQQTLFVGLFLTGNSATNEERIQQLNPENFKALHKFFIKENLKQMTPSQLQSINRDELYWEVRDEFDNLKDSKGPVSEEPKSSSVSTSPSTSPSSTAPSTTLAPPPPALSSSPPAPTLPPTGTPPTPPSKLASPPLPPPPAQPKQLTNKELEDLLKENKTLTDQNVDNIDFSKIKMDEGKFQLIFGKPDYTDRLTAEQEKRLKNLNSEQLTALIAFFKRDHFNALTPDQIAKINFAELLSATMPDKNKNLFDNIFAKNGSSPLSDQTKNRLKLLHGENLNVLVPYFDRWRAEALDLKQIAEINFKEAMQGATDKEKTSMLNVFFVVSTPGDTSRQMKDRLNDLSPENLNTLAGCFTRNHAFLIDPSQIPNIDFTKLVAGQSNERQKEIFNNFFGVGAEYSLQEDRARFGELHGKDLQTFVPFFERSHIMDVNLEQLQEIDFTKIESREVFSYFFGGGLMEEFSIPLMTRAIANLGAIQNPAHLIHLAKYFLESHWNALYQDQFEILQKEKDKLPPKVQPMIEKYKNKLRGNRNRK